MADFNLTHIDDATARISQAQGVLDLLTVNPCFDEHADASVLAALWAVQALIGQAHAAVCAIKTQDVPATA